MSTKKLGRQTPTGSVVLPYTHSEGAQAIAGAASAPDISEEKMVRRMTSTTENITRSFYDDYVETNVKYRSEAGLECFIIRSDHGGCCKWCAALAGKYRYPEEVPKDVYRRHDNCTCTVTYTNGRKAQDVWSKTSRELPAEERERMREIGFKKPTISAEERERMKQIGFKKPTISAEEREQMLITGMKKPQRLDIAGESGIIEEKITHNSAGKQVKTVKHINLQAEPNSITQKINSNGGIDRNYYDESGRQFKQVSNNDHNQPKKHPFGENGEHAHDYVYDDKGNLIDRPMRELNDEERKENEDIL